MLFKALKTLKRSFSLEPSFVLPPRVFKVTVNHLNNKDCKLIVNSSNIRCEIPFKSTDLLGDIKGRLAEETGSKSVIFINQDNIEIANNTRYSDVELEQLYFIIDDMWAFEIINFERSNLLTEENLPAADLSANELEDLRLPFLYQNEMLSYYKRLDINKLQSNVLDDVIKEVINKIPDHRITPVPLLSQLIIEYNELIKQYQTLRATKHELRNQANRKAKIIFAMGIAILALQIFLVIYGVYYIYSWDIMEPIVFFWQFAGGLVLASTFLWLKSRHDYGKLLGIVATKIEMRSYKRNGFDIREYKRLKALIRENRTNKLKNLIGEF